MEDFEKINIKLRIAQNLQLTSNKESGGQKKDGERPKSPSPDKGGQQLDAETELMNVSQNSKNNLMLYIAINSVIQKNKNLRYFHLIDQKLSNKSWQLLGQGIGQNTYIKEFAISTCNINNNNNIQELMSGLMKNDCLRKLNLSDNDLKDDQGITVLNMIKYQAEKRDRSQWLEGLRKPSSTSKPASSRSPGSRADKFRSPSKSYYESLVEQSVNINFKPDNPELPQSPNSFNVIKDRQAMNHQIKKTQIQFNDGLRELDLRKNMLGDTFLYYLQSCLRFDSYMKAIDLKHNKFSYSQLKMLIKSGSLNENNSLLSVDVRFNPGASDKILKHISLQLLKNISYLKNQAIDVDKQYVKWDVLYNPQIPYNLYQQLDLAKRKTRYKARAHNQPMKIVAHPSPRGVKQRDNTSGMQSDKPSNINIDNYKSFDAQNLTSSKHQKRTQTASKTSRKSLMEKNAPTYSDLKTKSALSKESRKGKRTMKFSKMNMKSRQTEIDSHEQSIGSQRSIRENSKSNSKLKTSKDELSQNDIDLLDNFLTEKDNSNRKSKSRDHSSEHIKKILLQQKNQIQELKHEIKELQRAREVRKTTYEDPKELLEKILEVIPEVASLTSQFGKYMSAMPSEKKETL